MALIVDPDLLADSAVDDGSTEVYINTSTRTIKLNTKDRVVSTVDSSGNRTNVTTDLT